MTTAQLKQIAIYASDANIILYTPLLNEYMSGYEINGRMRQSAYLAQIIHESGSFRYTKEITSGKAYEGRVDLGNAQPGDGVKYRGRALIQITGKCNYEKVSAALGIDFIANPELLEQPEYAVVASCWWWYDKGLNRLADVGKFKQITKKINGGYNGLADREFWYDRALKVL
ncbi:MAG TPA: chitinase [Porphyromonadaceae bacterium]|nr:chitinase [Porphyromonadaceae bacterium]